MTNPLADRGATAQHEPVLEEGDEPKSVPRYGQAANQPIAELDGLRGIAVLMVIAFHCLEPLQSKAFSWLEPARSVLWCGVDWFFVLSGFLITGILLRTRKQRGYFLIFFARRTCRIFPLYYLFIGAIVLVPMFAAWFIGKAQQITGTSAYQSIVDGMPWLLTYTHNFRQAAGPSTYPALGHIWSLAVEEQFYLVWPLIIYFVPTRWLRPLLVVGILTQPLLRFASIQYGMDAWAVMHLTFLRLDGLLAGSLLAVYWFELRDPSDRQRRCLVRTIWFSTVFSLAALLALSGLNGTLHWQNVANQPLVYLTVSMIAVCIIGHVLLHQRHRSVIEKWLSVTWLRSMGKYSYAMYIFHWPVAIAMTQVLGDVLDQTRGWQADVVSIGRFLVVTAVSVALAKVSWHGFEKHWLRLKPAYPDLRSPS